MPKDPSGHYKGNNYDPEYARKKWRKNQWGGGGHHQPAVPMPAAAMMPYDMGMMPYPPRMMPGPPPPGMGLPYGDEIDTRSAQSFRAGPTTVGRRDPYTRQQTGDYTLSASAPPFHPAAGVYSPSQPISRSMRPSSYSDADMGSPTPATATAAPTPPKDAPPPPTPKPSHLPPPEPAPPPPPPQPSSATAAAPAPSTGELGSLERLKLFKAQVEATRRSKLAAAEKQPEPAVAAELFLLSAAGAQLNGTSAPTEPAAAPEPAPEPEPEAGPSRPTAVATAPASPIASAPTPTAPAIAVEEGEIPDAREMRQQALREKLRLKIAQKAAMGESSAAALPLTPQATGGSPKPDVVAGDVPPPRADSRTENRRADIPPGLSFADAARQRFANRAEARQRRVANGRAHPRERDSDLRHDSLASSRNPSPIRRSPPPQPRDYRPPSPHDERELSMLSEPQRRRGSSPDSSANRRPSNAPSTELAATCVLSLESANPISTTAGAHERERDVLAMPPPDHVPQSADPVTRSATTAPTPANTMEAWALSQVQLLKQQQEGIARQIAEMEKLLKSGVLRPAPVAVPQTPVSVPPYQTQFQSATRQSVSPVRTGYRTPRERDDGLSQPSREQSPYSAATASQAGMYRDEVGERGRERVRSSPSYGPPYGPKDYDVGEYRTKPPHKHSFGKAPPYYKAHHKPYYKPYNKSRPYDEYERAPRYVASAGTRLERTPSADRPGFKPFDAGFRY